MQGDWNGIIVLNVSFIIFLFQFNAKHHLIVWMFFNESMSGSEKVSWFQYQLCDDYSGVQKETVPKFTANYYIIMIKIMIV